jgi:hypothetical protein
MLAIHTYHMMPVFKDTGGGKELGSLSRTNRKNKHKVGFAVTQQQVNNVMLLKDQLED